MQLNKCHSLPEPNNFSGSVSEIGPGFESVSVWSTEAGSVAELSLDPDLLRNGTDLCPVYRNCS